MSVRYGVEGLSPDSPDSRFTEPMNLIDSGATPIVLLLRCATVLGGRQPDFDFEAYSMIARNLNWLAGGAALGLLGGLAITIPAHHDNPFLTAPGVFFGLVVAGIGSLTSALMLLLVKRHSSFVAGLCGFFLMMLAVLVLTPLAWPYPTSDEARPVTDVGDVGDPEDR